MKLKEMLAEKNTEKVTHNDPYSLSISDIHQGYIAGFEKARELAADLFKNSWNNNPKYLGRLYPDALKLIAADCEQVGEEEV